MGTSGWKGLLPVYACGFCMGFAESSNPGFFHHAALSEIFLRRAAARLALTRVGVWAWIAASLRASQ